MYLWKFNFVLRSVLSICSRLYDCNSIGMVKCNEMYRLDRVLLLVFGFSIFFLFFFGCGRVVNYSR